MLSNRFKFNTQDSQELIKLISKVEFATEQYFTTSDIEGRDSRKTQRNIANWEKDGLLLNDEWAPNKKRQYTFLEVVWIHVIIELKRFGFPSKEIRKLKFEIFEQFALVDLLKMLSQNIEVSPEGTSSAGEVDNQLVNDFMVSLIKSSGLSLMSCALADCMISKQNLYLAITLGSGAHFLTERSLLESTTFSSGTFKKTRIVVPIHEIIRKILMNEKLNFIAPKLNLLTVQELAIITELRNCKVRSIEVFFRNGKIDRYEKKNLIMPDTHARLTELISSARYQRMRIEIENGEVVLFEQDVKEKL